MNKHDEDRAITIFVYVMAAIIGIVLGIACGEWLGL